MNRHFPITTGRYELDEPIPSIGQHFTTELIPLGQISILSGRLAIGDPLLGMAAANNPWLAVCPGTYSVVLTRLTSVSLDNIDIPAYLSIILDPEEIEKRRQWQADKFQWGGNINLPQNLISYLIVSDDGKIEEVEDPEFGDEDTQNSIIGRSGVVCFVDAVAFENRMPDPLTIPGGWFSKYFDAQSQCSWTSFLDDKDHIASGIANLHLPAGPDDWSESRPATIALAQMTEPGRCLAFIEYASSDDRRLNPIAIHLEMGLQESMREAGLKPAS